MASALLTPSSIISRSRLLVFSEFDLYCISDGLTQERLSAIKSSIIENPTYIFFNGEAFQFERYGLLFSCFNFDDVLSFKKGQKRQVFGKTEDVIGFAEHPCCRTLIIAMNSNSRSSAIEAVPIPKNFIKVGVRTETLCPGTVYTIHLYRS